MKAEEAKLLTDEKWREEIKKYLDNILEQIKRAADRGEYSTRIHMFSYDTGRTERVLSGGGRRGRGVARWKNEPVIQRLPVSVGDPRTEDMRDLLHGLGYETEYDQETLSFGDPLLKISWRQQKSEG